MNSQRDDSLVPLFYLSLYMGGGGPFSVGEIIAVCDWALRLVPTRDEFEYAFNSFLALGLVELNEDQFKIPEANYIEFKSFLKKKRKHRFDVARLYFKNIQLPTDPPQIVSYSEEEYHHCYNEYKKRMLRSKK